MVVGSNPTTPTSQRDYPLNRLDSSISGYVLGCVLYLAGTQGREIEGLLHSVPLTSYPLIRKEANVNVLEWHEGEDRFAVTFEDSITDDGEFIWLVSKWRPSKGNENFDYPRVGDRVASKVFYTYMGPPDNETDMTVLRLYAEKLAPSLEYKW